MPCRRAPLGLGLGGVLAMLVCTTSVLLGVKADATAANSPRVPLIRGVNLGGWLVLEPWVRPSLFEVDLSGGQQQPVDEYTLSQYFGRDKIDAFMEAHYDSWISRADLAAAAAAGINTIRIPVGYWAVDRMDTEPYASSDLVWRYLTRTLDWCKELGLAVQVDIHALPGSQNALDHSGRRGSIDWPQAANYQRSIEVVRKFVTQLNAGGYFAPTGPVTQFQPVNEPWMTLDIDFLLGFYQTVYPIIRSSGASAEHVTIVFSDSWRLADPALKTFGTDGSMKNIILDQHYYQIFEYNGLSMSRQQHIDSTRGYFGDVVANKIPTRLMVGEFTLATTDCAKWLTGVNMGYRWNGTFVNEKHEPVGQCTGDNSNDASQWSLEYRTWLKSYAEALFDTFENAMGLPNPDTNVENRSSGWFFWTLKTENAPHWDLLAGLRGGWIPTPITSRGLPFSPIANGNADTSAGSMSVASPHLLTLALAFVGAFAVQHWLAHASL